MIAATEAHQPPPVPANGQESLPIRVGGLLRCPKCGQVQPVESYRRYWRNPDYAHATSDVWGCRAVLPEGIRCRHLFALRD
jgi:hypothetical protein